MAATIPSSPAFLLQALRRALRTTGGPQIATPAIHALLITSGLLASDLFLSNSLISIYARSNRLPYAQLVFRSIPHPDISSWNSLLSGSSDPTLPTLLHRLGVIFNHVTFISSFASASASASHARDALPLVLQLHSHLLKSGFHSHTGVGNSLLTAYSRCCSQLDVARKVFDEMPEKDVISWNAMMSGYVQRGGVRDEAIRLFAAMNRGLALPNDVSIAIAIMACGHEKDLACGEQIHTLAVKVGVETRNLVSNVLVSMYEKCGAVDRGRKVFDRTESKDVISWTSLIGAAARLEEALELFRKMRIERVPPSEVTFIVLIHAASSDGEAAMLHGLCYSMGFYDHVDVSNGLISAYAKAGSVGSSRKVFDEMVYQEQVSWNALISGYAHNDMCEDALVAFSSLLLQPAWRELKPNQYTFGSLLSALSRAESVPLAYGLRCHCRALKLGLDSDVHVSSALIDMYAKRGEIDDSWKLFGGASPRTRVSWTSMISAHALRGDYGLVIRLFDEMVGSGVGPDRKAFLAALTACRWRGMVKRGLEIFESMRREYGVEPRVEHYTSVVDMLVRAARLEQAEMFIEKMAPKEPSISTLQAFLGACRVRGDANMCRRIEDKLVCRLGYMQRGTRLR